MNHRISLKLVAILLGAPLLACASLALAQPTFGNPSRAKSNAV